MAKIVIDPGHGGADAGSNYNGRREKDDVLRLALEVGKKLEQRGQNISYTRVNDVQYSPFERAVMANTAAADFFLSLHRNSVRNPNTINGVEAYVYDNSGIKVEVAEKLLERLAEIDFENRGILERPNIMVLQRTDMPAVLLEVGFIDSETDNQIFDTKFDEIAEEIADVVARYAKRFPVRRPPLYRVQTGAFRNYENAAAMANRLQSEGYPAFVLYGDGIYRVQVGAYEILDNAIRMEQKLRKDGYSTFIVRG